MGLSTYVFVPTSHGRMTESVSHAMLRASVVFGFTAALLEDIPVIGLAFTVSNRIGAAMWAHGTLLCLALWFVPWRTDPDHKDLEKRQHYIAERRKLGHAEVD